MGLAPLAAEDFAWLASYTVPRGVGWFTIYAASAAEAEQAARQHLREDEQLVSVSPAYLAKKSA